MTILVLIEMSIRIENKLGLSWAKLSPSCDCGLVEVDLNRIKIDLTYCPNVLLKSTQKNVSLCIS